MGLFDIIKKKLTERKSSPLDKEKIKAHLDSVQSEIYSFLKPLGFKKKGRTFNRQTENGIYQVINLQSGRYDFGDKYVIPGIRENYYGKFTVNLGVLVKELYELDFHKKGKDFYQEYSCQIRDRLSNLTIGQDYWWTITPSTKEIAREIIDGLNSKGLNWLDTFDTREKICKNWGTEKNHALRAKLDVGLITIHTDKEKGQKIIQDYYNNLDQKGHKDYVMGLSKRLGFQLNS